VDDRDYLLGVSDEIRQGALRFKTDVDGEFQHSTPEVPKLIALPTLLHAADAMARDKPGSKRWLARPEFAMWSAPPGPDQTATATIPAREP
jgi:hypothetical protein